MARRLSTALMVLLLLAPVLIADASAHETGRGVFSGSGIGGFSVAEGVVWGRFVTGDLDAKGDLRATGRCPGTTTSKGINATFTGSFDGATWSGSYLCDNGKTGSWSSERKYDWSGSYRYSGEVYPSSGSGGGRFEGTVTSSALGDPSAGDRELAHPWAEEFTGAIFGNSFGMSGYLCPNYGSGYGRMDLSATLDPATGRGAASVECWPWPYGSGTVVRLEGPPTPLEPGTPPTRASCAALVLTPRMPPAHDPRAPMQATGHYSARIELAWSGAAGEARPVVTLSASGMPTGMTADFSASPFRMPSDTFTLIMEVRTDAAPEGAHLLTITGEYDRAGRRCAVTTQILVAVDVAAFPDWEPGDPTFGEPPPARNTDARLVARQGNVTVTSDSVPRASDDERVAAWDVVETGLTDEDLAHLVTGPSFVTVGPRSTVTFAPAGLAEEPKGEYRYWQYPRPPRDEWFRPRSEVTLVDGFFIGVVRFIAEITEGFVIVADAPSDSPAPSFDLVDHVVMPEDVRPTVVMTPTHLIVPNGTEYVVAVVDGITIVDVLDGSVLVVDRRSFAAGEEPPTRTLAAGRKLILDGAEAEETATTWSIGPPEAPSAAPAPAVAWGIRIVALLVIPASIWGMSRLVVLAERDHGGRRSFIAGRLGGLLALGLLASGFSIDPLMRTDDGVVSDPASMLQGAAVLVAAAAAVVGTINIFRASAERKRRTWEELRRKREEPGHR